MSRTEVIAKRTSRSKTFANDDGTFTLECGGGHAHHMKDGAWVDTDTTWRDLGTEFGSGEYPYQVRFNKGTHALAILLPGEVVPFTIAPIGRNKKAVPAYSANTITIPNLWPGVTALWLLTPERPVLHFIKTAHPCTNPQVQVIGTDPAPMMSAYYEDGMETVQVPVTQAAGVVTYDLSAVPLNVRVM